MNKSQRDSAKIKSYELAYRAWLRRVFKSFGKYSLAKTLEALENDAELTPEIIEYFYHRLNFDPINKTFNGVLEQNEKFFEKLILESKSRSERYQIKKVLDKTLPQRAIFNSFTQEGVQKKRVNFFELEKQVIKFEMKNNFIKRKKQLDEFRQSFLFKSPDNAETFKEKYPEPKYKFTDSMGRTEVNNLNRDLNAVLATNLGAKKCEWVTSGDERVRESHRLLDGKIFDYDNLPMEYNDYNCRCNLLPIIESIEGIF